MDELIKPFYSETKTSSIKVEEIKPTISKPAKDESQEHKKSDFGFDFSFFTDPDKAVISINNTTPSTTTTTTPRKTRTTKKTKKLDDGSEIVLSEEETTTEHQNPFNATEPYANSYKETDALLKMSIMQIDSMNNDIKNDIDSIRASKTLKNKYNYITEMTSTSGTLLSTKITAIRELNNTIKSCQDLELKRMKEMKAASALENQDDDRRMMDMYTAFINTPIGNYSLAPSNIDMTTGGAGVVPGGDIGSIVRADSANTGDAGYNNYLNNLTPVQNAMRMENNPNIMTVVKYNSETGQRWFDVINKNTGESIPNVPRPDEFLLENLHINVAGGFCRDTQLDRTYPLVVVGDNKSIMQY